MQNNTRKLDQTTDSLARSSTIRRVPESRSDVQEMVCSLLASKLKLISCDQVARTFFSHRKDPKDAARRCLNVLRKKGVIEVSTFTIAVLPSPDAPLAVVPKESIADVNYASLAWTLTKREQRLSNSMCTIARISDKGCRQYGGKKASLRIGQLTHDLFVTDVALVSTNRGTWVREDYIADFGIETTKPDALLLPDTVIEIGGSSYDKTRLKIIFTEFADYEVELW